MDKLTGQYSDDSTNLTLSSDEIGYKNPNEITL